MVFTRQDDKTNPPGHKNDPRTVAQVLCCSSFDVYFFITKLCLLEIKEYTFHSDWIGRVVRGIEESTNERISSMNCRNQFRM